MAESASKRLNNIFTLSFFIMLRFLWLFTNEDFIEYSLLVGGYPYDIDS